MKRIPATHPVAIEQLEEGPSFVISHSPGLHLTEIATSRKSVCIPDEELGDLITALWNVRHRLFREAESSGSDRR